MYLLKIYRSQIINKLFDQQRCAQVPLMLMHHMGYASQSRSSEAEVNQRSERSLNKVQLIGRVAANPDQRGINTSCTSFPLATNRTVKLESGNYKKVTQWHKIVCFDKEIQRYVMNDVRKGDRLHLTGHIEYTDYTGYDRQQKTQTEIVAEDIIRVNEEKQYDQNEQLQTNSIAE